MLPVEFDDSGVLADDAVSDKPIDVELTLGKTDPMLDLSDPDNPSEDLGRICRRFIGWLRWIASPARKY